MFEYVCMYVSTPRRMCMCVYGRALSGLGNNEASVGSPNCVYCITVRGQKKVRSPGA